MLDKDAPGYAPEDLTSPKAEGGQMPKYKDYIRSVVCQYCGNQANLVMGDKIYPHRKDLFTKKFYICESCQAWVGTHRDGTPLGRLANKELRLLKKKAHDSFDPLWRYGAKNRQQAYRWLAKEMNLSREQCHIGMFNEEQCKKVIEICREKTGVGY